MADDYNYNDNHEETYEHDEILLKTEASGLNRKFSTSDWKNTEKKDTEFNRKVFDCLKQFPHRRLESGDLNLDLDIDHRNKFTVLGDMFYCLIRLEFNKSDIGTLCEYALTAEEKKQQTDSLDGFTAKNKKIKT